MSKFRTVSLTVCVLILSGCANIMSGSKDSVVVSSSPVGAEFSIKDENNKAVHHGTTPATVTLDRGDGYFDGQTYTFDFAANGYLPQSKKVDSSINGWYFGNFLFGGLIGLLIVDPASGAMWSLPDDVNVSLSPAPQAKINTTEELKTPTPENATSRP